MQEATDLQNKISWTAEGAYLKDRYGNTIFPGEYFIFGQDAVFGDAVLLPFGLNSVNRLTAFARTYASYFFRSFEPKQNREKDSSLVKLNEDVLDEEFKTLCTDVINAMTKDLVILTVATKEQLDVHIELHDILVPKDSCYNKIVDKALSNEFCPKVVKIFSKAPFSFAEAFKDVNNAWIHSPIVECTDKNWTSLSKAAMAFKNKGFAVLHYSLKINTSTNKYLKEQDRYELDNPFRVYELNNLFRANDRIFNKDILAKYKEIREELEDDLNCRRDLWRVI